MGAPYYFDVKNDYLLTFVKKRAMSKSMILIVSQFFRNQTCCFLNTSFSPYNVHFSLIPEVSSKEGKMLMYMV